MTLSANEAAELQDALNYMTMEELSAECTRLGFKAPERKEAIVRAICGVVLRGHRPFVAAIPKPSRARPGMTCPLQPDAFILHGAYKNNDETREFLKGLVGPHFHFTAFGQRWIRMRWMAGRPPTYAQFARAWQREYLRRRGRTRRRLPPGPLNPEWAYLSFLQRSSTEGPGSRAQRSAQWTALRAAKAKRARVLLRRARSS